MRRKLDGARSLAPAPEVQGSGKVEVGIIAYGSSHHAVVETRAQLRDERDLETDYLRVRAYPFAREVEAFVAAHRRVYVVEQNRDAQMLGLLKLDLPAELLVRLRSVAHVDGLPLDARSVTEEIAAKEGLS